MPIDMQQFHAVFFEESQEHLAEMEQLLLQVDVANPDNEQLNSIFRAAHSIKGGSGIFGFDALGSVTHVMENLLDKLRQGQLQLTNKMIDVLLDGVDVLKSILIGYINSSPVDSVAENRIIESVESIATSARPMPKDEVFGFFEDALAETANENADISYGFFEAPYISSQEEAYGFFEESTASSPEAYGFFDVPESDDTIRAQAISSFHSKEPKPEEDAFGFFEPLAKDAAETSDDKKILSKNTSPPSKQPMAQLGEKPGTAAKKSSESSSVESGTIRVDVTKVDQLINLVGEIVITQSMLNLIGKSISGPLSEKFQMVAGELERNTREIQEAVMSIRMLPISFVFNRFPRVVRDLASKLGKSIDLIIEGGETELDKGLTEKLVDPLTHLVRNSIDHGIESADLRRARGKAATGRVVLRAAQQGGNIVISISDDGGGLSREKILAKARERDIAVADNPSDAEVWQLIFAPGFSTAEQITDVSGRGVGLDVVKRNVQTLGGRIDISSVAEQGASFTITLPLTLAIVDGMGVTVGSQTFIIPLVHIVESMQPAAKDVKTLVGDDQLLLVRDQYWPILPLHKLMQVDPVFTQVHQGIAVLVETAKHKFALFVDALVGQQQVVIKSLERHYKRVQGVAGATIMGDGSVALILDVESLGLEIPAEVLKMAS